MENKNLVKCKACGADIAKGVKKCPHCGKDQRNFFMRHKVISIILVLTIIGAIGSALNGGGDDKTATTNSTKQDNKNTTESTNTRPKITEKKYSYDKFMQIEMGMTYDQVKAILGDGTEESSTGDGDLKTITYRWQNSGGSNLSITLQGGKVINKTQAFLQSMDAKVTMDKYNQIKNGMSYDQVKGILGDGQLTSLSVILDSKSEIYEWINAGGANINVTFNNGVVESKAQVGLK